MSHDKCNLDNCVNPTQARAAMEACGIDVYTTVKNSRSQAKF